MGSTTPDTRSTVPAGRPTTPASRLPSLTGLRWIGAMLVFGFHVGTMHVIADPGIKVVSDKVFTLGLSGVQFFFILSGFVLVWSARPGERWRTFWRRRFAKIYPNHVVMWAVVLLFGLYLGRAHDPWVALTNLLLLQTWTPRLGWFYSINTVSWSLSCELFFYLCLPLALPLVRRARVGVLYGVVVAVPLLILALWPAQHLLPAADRWWFTQVFPPVRSLEFWLGVAAGELMARGRWRGPGLWPATGVFLATWVGCATLVPAQLWTTLLAVAYILVIAAAADADVRGARSPWRSRPMRWLGEVSFAYYLVHVFVVTTVLGQLGRPRGFPGWWGPLAAVGFLLLNLALAALLHRFVETPMMRLLGPRRRPAPAGRSAGSTPAAAAVSPPEPHSVAAQSPSARPVVVESPGSRPVVVESPGSRLVAAESPGSPSVPSPRRAADPLPLP
ncbi:acyltransferase family protein [Plantactinospora siamensis]|uniref:Acyltransferase family protein n=1 Tax=Plantactinospora siamensis TaxID=555372 RepID=A0ABV6P0K4_9ACTN